MGYPNASNFISADPYSAWWFVVTGNTSSANAPYLACATQGMSFIKRLQRRLGVSETGAWDQATANALAASVIRDDVVQQVGAGFGQIHDTLLAEAGQQRISELALRYALWFCYLRAPAPATNPYHPIESVRIAQNTVYPRWGVAADNDLAFGMPDGGATCWDPQTQQAPGASLPAPRPGQQGGNLPTGRSTGSMLFLNPTTGDIDPMKTALVLAAVGGLGYVAWTYWGDMKPSRASSRRSRASSRRSR